MNTVKLRFHPANKPPQQPAPLAQVSRIDLRSESRHWPGLGLASSLGNFYSHRFPPPRGGIAGSFLDQNDPTRAHLISMWTAPTHRQRSIGRLLANHVLNWARGRNAHILPLMVTSSNEPAIDF